MELDRRPEGQVRKLAKRPSKIQELEWGGNRDVTMIQKVKYFRRVGK